MIHYTLLHDGRQAAEYQHARCKKGQLLRWMQNPHDSASSRTSDLRIDDRRSYVSCVFAGRIRCRNPARRRLSGCLLRGRRSPQAPRLPPITAGAQDETAGDRRLVAGHDDGGQAGRPSFRALLTFTSDGIVLADETAQPRMRRPATAPGRPPAKTAPTSPLSPLSAASPARCRQLKVVGSLVYDADADTWQGPFTIRITDADGAEVAGGRTAPFDAVRIGSKHSTRQAKSLPRLPRPCWGRATRSARWSCPRGPTRLI